MKPKPTSPRAVSFCQGIDSILNFRAAKAAKARPVTIGYKGCVTARFWRTWNWINPRKFQIIQQSFPVSLLRGEGFVFVCFESETLDSWTRSWHWRQRNAQCKNTRILQGAASSCFLILLVVPGCRFLVFRMVGGSSPPTQGLLWTLDHV